MRFLPGLALLFLVMMVTAPVFSQMYQYTDADGNVRFTDNLANIPEPDREAVETMEAVAPALEEGQTVEDNMPLDQPPPEPETDEEDVDEFSGELPEEGAPPPPSPSGSAAQEDQFLADRQSLESERTELEALYQEIEEEKKNLGPPPAEPASRLNRRVYEQNALDLNKRIEDYQSRAEAYRKRLEAFNAGDPQKAMR